LCAFFSSLRQFPNLPEFRKRVQCWTCRSGRAARRHADLGASRQYAANRFGAPEGGDRHSARGGATIDPAQPQSRCSGGMGRLRAGLHGADFPKDPIGDPRRRAMDWVVHYFDRKLNRETVSREYSAKEGALRSACDLMRRQCDVRYIEGPERERVQAPEIYAWCKAHRTAERPKDSA
jgi:hypothetical protein